VSVKGGAILYHTAILYQYSHSVQYSTSNYKIQYNTAKTKFYHYQHSTVKYSKTKENIMNREAPAIGLLLIGVFLLFVIFFIIVNSNTKWTMTDPHNITQFLNLSNLLN
jgi:hypothetical protein